MKSKDEIAKFGGLRADLCVRLRVVLGAVTMGLSSMRPHSSAAGDAGSDRDTGEGCRGGSARYSREVQPLQIAYLVGSDRL